MLPLHTSDKSADMDAGRFFVGVSVQNLPFYNTVSCLLFPPLLCSVQFNSIIHIMPRLQVSSNAFNGSASTSVLILLYSRVANMFSSLQSRVPIRSITQWKLGGHTISVYPDVLKHQLSSYVVLLSLAADDMHEEQWCHFRAPYNCMCFSFLTTEPHIYDVISK